VHETAVDNLVAGGFGSLTSDEVSPVQGVGEWRDGRWRVVFSRPLEVGREGNVELPAETKTDLAFAVWDGSAGERNGMKSVSGFATLSVSSDLAPSGGSFLYFLVGIVLSALLGMWIVSRPPKGSPES
jgi:complex iron-sulfur molybdoenzyme family reductase subunit gamma